MDDRVTLWFFLVPWLVAMWAMIMMLVVALNDRERLSLGWIFFGSFLKDTIENTYGYLWVPWQSI